MTAFDFLCIYFLILVNTLSDNFALVKILAFPPENLRLLKVYTSKPKRDYEGRRFFNIGAPP